MKEKVAQRRTDRRVTARYACHLHVDYRADREWRRATVMDVSRNGCRLRLGEELERGTTVGVRFTHTGADGQTLTAQAEGRAIWSRVEGLSHQAGIHFPEESAELQAIIAALR